MDRHESQVAAISSRIKDFYATKTPFRVYHGSTSSARASAKTRANTVDTSALTNVISVDTESCIATVEPNVSMLALTKKTLYHNLVPQVVMEFTGITVGGGFSGTSGESSSFRFGPFENTVEWIEIVLGDGEVTRASRTENQDLFWGAASGFGTMGVVTLLGVRLIKSESRNMHVRLSYRLSPNFGDAVQVLREDMTKEGVDYLDAVVFAPDCTVTCTGKIVELPKGHYGKAFLGPKDPWFYLRVQEVAKALPESPDGIVDYIPILDYLFRWDRGAFWVGRYAFRYFFTPFNSVTRSLLDRFMGSKVMYHAYHESGLTRFHIAQDVGVPFDRAVEFASWLDTNMKFYPLWLCPLRMKRDPGHSDWGLHSAVRNGNTPDVINFGVWSPIMNDEEEVTRLNRALEDKLFEVEGRKCLYAQTCYTEEEFWRNYDRMGYDALREKYRASHLPSVYDKVKRQDESAQKGRLTPTEKLRKRTGRVRPLRGLYGVYKLVRGSDYLLKEAKPLDKRTLENGA